MATKKEASVDITKEDFEKIQSRMKELDNGWAETLVQMINKEIDADPVKYAALSKCDRIKVYNVMNGVVRNAKWKMLVYAQGLELIRQLELQFSNLKDQAKKIV